MLNQLFVTKQSMSQSFVDGRRLPVTLLSLPRQVIVKVNPSGQTGTSSLQIAIDQKKSAPNRPLQGHLRSAKVDYQPRWLREVKVDSSLSLKPADPLPLADIIAPGDTVKVTSASKGKGFSGVVKRYHFAGGPRTHGQSDRSRAPGSIGRGTTPGRVLPGKKMAGHLGSQAVTVKNLKVIRLDLEKNQLLVSGPIPGARGALIRLTVTKKAPSQE